MHLLTREAVPTTLKPTSGTTSHSPTDPILIHAKFLTYDDAVAGRRVLIVLYAPNGSQAQRLAAWQSRTDKVNMAALGKAAKSLQKAGNNWRGMSSYREVLSAYDNMNT